eukprot:XP_011666517.1 PREDICTED: selenocysteine lyase-like [Strongylocentrotus purpuratus]
MHNRQCTGDGNVTTEQIYLDYNATTPVESAVIDIISRTLSEAWGNPSSPYPPGQLAKQLINKARLQVATMIGASPHDIIFMSGGTEANNLVIHTAIEHFKNSSRTLSYEHPGKPHIITSNLEHNSIKLPLEHLVNQGVADVTFVPASVETGRVEADSIVKAIQPTTCLVTIMHANNETGVIQPVEEIFRRLKGISHDPSQVVPRILLHTDAAQTIGKIRVDVDSLNADYLTIVGHKFYAPRIGALYVRGGGGTSERGVPLYPMLFGGGQERNFRPGTENTAMIAGLGKAAELVTENIEQYDSKMRKVRDYLEESLKSTFQGQVCFNGKLKGSERIPNTCNVSFLGTNRQGRKILSKVKRLQASVGAACHSDTGDRPSHILLAIGVPNEVATNALRLSVGRHTTLEDIDAVVKDIQDSLETLKSEVDS